MSGPDMSPLDGAPTRALTPSEVAHREAFRDYVLAEAELWHREHLGRLYAFWDEWNATYFGGAMVPPLILLSEPSEPKRYGDCGSVSGWGARSQIRIRPSLLAGTHPHVRKKDGYAEGRFRFVADVLLHEMIHQWQQEVSGQLDKHYHGHGPAFRRECCRIGALLGLPPVRTCKRRGKEAGLPSCSQWPHNVRPEGFYLGAYIPPTFDDDDHPKAETLTIPADPAGMLSALTLLLAPEEARALARGLDAHFGHTTLVQSRDDIAQQQGAA